MSERFDTSLAVRPARLPERSVSLRAQSAVAARGRCANAEKPAHRVMCGLFVKNAGGDLLSHAVSHAVPSALKSLASEFGMGSGVSSSLQLPAKLRPLTGQQDDEVIECVCYWNRLNSVE